MRFVSVLLHVFGVLIVLLAGIWGCGALFFQADLSRLFLAAAISGFACLTLLACFGLFTHNFVLVSVWVAALAGLIVWWQTVLPAQDRDWAQAVSRQPHITISGNDVTVQNVRHFDWRSDTDFTARWEERRFSLTDIQGVDLFFSYWMGPAIAHLIVSLPIKNDVPLTFSIEVRREKTEAYSAIAGFFKNYELIVLAGDERDIVKLRTNVWREDVHLYRLRVTPEKAQALLRGYVREIDSLAKTPQFYNTVTNNCTNIVYRLARELWPDLRPDWRVLASGYLPELLYQIGSLGGQQSFAALKDRSRISKTAQGVGSSADFSSQIRAGYPVPD